MKNVTYAIRALLRAPGMAATAILTLALGIGVNTALFSFIDGVFLKPHPAIGEADGLHWVNEVVNDHGYRYSAGLTYPIFEQLRARGDVVEEITIFRNASVGFSAGGEPQEVEAEVVDGSYFSMLRLQMALGRGFLPEEDRTPGTHPVVVLGYDLWQNRFGGSADVLGRAVRINGEWFTIVGVGPEGFRGMRDMSRPAELWVPTMMYPVVLRSDDDPLGVDYGVRSTNAVARLAPGVSPERAAEVVTTLLQGMAGEYPDAYAGAVGRLDPLRGIAGPIEPRRLAGIAFALTSITLIVLLIACGNVANLLLARAAVRRREIAIRAALGASRAQIVGLLLIESVVLAVVGSGAALLAARWMIDLYAALSPAPLPVPVTLDLRVFLVTLLIAVATGILVGLSPALRASRADVTGDLKGTSAGSRSGVRPQAALVAGQLALSCVLLVGAAVMARTLWSMVATDRQQPAREEVLALTFNLTAKGYPQELVPITKQRILDHVAAVPGVEAATLSTFAPFDLGLAGSFKPDQEGTSTTQGRREIATIYYIRPSYFETVRIPLIRGRDFTPHDDQSAPLAAIINEAAARQWWPGENPLGRQLHMMPDSAPWMTVVGIAADALHDIRGDERITRPAVYRSELQMSRMIGPEATILARTRGDARRFRDPLVAAIHAVDPDLPVYRIRTLGEMIDEQQEDRWIVSGLMVGVGALALLLATIGLHGLVAFTVAQRTREVGIRMSLGASKRDVLGLFTGALLRYAGAGVAVGLVLALGVAWTLRAILFEVDMLDAIAFAAVGGLLLAVALLAGALTARRATQVDPMVALRAD